MAQTVVGLYERFEDAQAAVRDLVDSGIPRDSISLIAHRESTGLTGTETFDTIPAGATSHDTNAGKGATTGSLLGGLTGFLIGMGFLAIPGVGPLLAAGPLLSTLAGAGLGAAAGGLLGTLTHAGIPEEEAGYYAEGIRRGGTLVAVSVDEARGSAVADILNRHHPIDIEERGGHYRSTGFTGYSETVANYTPEQIAAERTRFAAATPHTTVPSANTTNRTVAAGETVTVPVIEEELTVGKREVQRGGARVHTRVIETPVSEQISLHEERVTVDRHAVDRPVSQTDLADALQERTIELTETSEVPVVAKQARVIEEVTVGKASSDRVETIRDTVRSTDVDVEEIDDESPQATTMPGGRTP